MEPNLTKTPYSNIPIGPPPPKSGLESLIDIDFFPPRTDQLIQERTQDIHFNISFLSNEDITLHLQVDVEDENILLDDFGG